MPRALLRRLESLPRLRRDGDDARGDAHPGATARVGLEVVRFFLDHDRAPEDGAATLQGNPGVQPVVPRAAGLVPSRFPRSPRWRTLSSGPPCMELYGLRCPPRDDPSCAVRSPNSWM
jgi:hypothetical protein